MHRDKMLTKNSRCTVTPPHNGIASHIDTYRYTTHIYVYVYKQRQRNKPRHKACTLAQRNTSKFKDRQS